MTPGIDTYITVAQADEILGKLLLSTDAQRIAWTGLSDGDKEVYLRQAMTRLEAQVYSGAASADKPLQFPRRGQTEVPGAVMYAQAVEAAAAIGLTAEAAKRAQLRAMGIQTFSAGRISESYNNVPPNALYSLQAAQLLRPYVAGGVPFG